MKVRITSRHQKLSAQIKDYLEDKINRLEKYYDKIIDCEVIMDAEKTKELVEINIKVYGTILHVKARENDVTKAIDTATDKLEVQLKKFKGKLRKRTHDRMSDILNEKEDALAELE
ncbi:ribosome-associated translation inhibitor RaiA [bacterium]|nr:ribosome-associated translation inhibitor RaiA [bacterium]